MLRVTCTKYMYDYFVCIVIVHVKVSCEHASTFSRSPRNLSCLFLSLCERNLTVDFPRYQFNELYILIA